MALVFTGDEFADGGNTIRAALSKHKVKGSFFFTGKFYDNPSFESLIKGLKSDGNYLGAHSDQHLLYCDWTKRDSLLVTKNQFSEDLKACYEKMAKFGIQKADAQYFLPPYEWYNSSIVKWTIDEALKLINFTPGTRTPADYTYPDMGKRYVDSHEILNSIRIIEQKDPAGLNGFMLLIHIGTDPRRTDKFYDYLDELLGRLISDGYSFVKVDELL